MSAATRAITELLPMLMKGAGRAVVKGGKAMGPAAAETAKMLFQGMPARAGASGVERFASGLGGVAGGVLIGQELAGQGGRLGRAAFDSFNPAAGRQETGEYFAQQELFDLLRDRRDKTRQAIQQNLMQMARVNPRMFTELMAGRQLPRGAIVIGGEPRGDLLSQVAAMMMESAERPR